MDTALRIRLQSLQEVGLFASFYLGMVMCDHSKGKRSDMIVYGKAICQSTRARKLSALKCFRNITFSYDVSLLALRMTVHLDSAYHFSTLDMPKGKKTEMIVYGKTTCRSIRVYNSGLKVQMRAQKLVK